VRAAFAVKLFGPAREAVGHGSVKVDVTLPATAADVIEALERAHPPLAPLLPRSRVAVDRTYVDLTVPLDPGCEVAIIPPVGGG